MSEMGNSQALSRLMQTSTQALYACQEGMKKLAKNDSLGQSLETISIDQTELLLKLMEALVDVKSQLNQELGSGRVVSIDSSITQEMKRAIERTIANPIDAKINQVYLSIFGFNSPLWHVLREIQKLLETAKLFKDPHRKRVTKVEKKRRERRKRRHEKDNLQTNENEASL